MISFTIFGELIDLNTYINGERRSRYIGASIKKENTETVMWQTKNLDKVKNYPVTIEMHWYTPNEKKDPDNVAFAKKYILDALVENGILENDGRKQILGFKDLFFTDKKEPRIKVGIHETN